MQNSRFNALLQIMDTLREKCPWDRKQTIDTLRQMTLEETYELNDAIIEKDWKGIKEELGDILLHIVFYAKVAAEKKEFTIDEVIDGICEKLIRRHPHIYSPQDMDRDLKEVSSEDDVKQNWEKLKLKEGKMSALSGLPVSLPTMVKAIRLQEKAKQVGFEWQSPEEVWAKVQEEIGELKDAVKNKSLDLQEEELGDLIFSIINYARFLNIDADAALEKTNRKFKTRFMKMEHIARERGKSLSEMTLSQMDTIWNDVKCASAANIDE